MSPPPPAAALQLELAAAETLHCRIQAHTTLNAPRYTLTASVHVLLPAGADCDRDLHRRIRQILSKLARTRWSLQLLARQRDPSGHETLTYRARTEGAADAMPVDAGLRARELALEWIRVETPTLAPAGPSRLPGSVLRELGRQTVKAVRRCQHQLASLSGRAWRIATLEVEEWSEPRPLSQTPERATARCARVTLVTRVVLEARPATVQ